MNNTITNSNIDPKNHLIFALARAKQSSILIKTFLKSFFIKDNMLVNIYDVSHRLLYVDLYLLFDKQKKHLNIKKILDDNKNLLKNTDYLKLISSLDTIENKYSDELNKIDYIGNSIIRHIDPEKISIVYGSSFSGEYALDIPKVENMIDEVVTLLRESNIFAKESFQGFDDIIEYEQIVARCNLEVQKPITPSL
jgi:hypothetical protein